MKINTYILSTAELDQTLLDKALAHGIELDAVPFIQVDAIKDIHLDEELTELSHRPLTVVFTSANAVDAMSGILNTQRPKWSVYCIGKATKKAVLRYFDEAQVKGTANDGAQLAEVIKAHGIKEIIFFCGDKRLDALPDLLNKNDILVREIVVYKTRETPQLVTKHYSGIMFFSPNGVNSFFRVNSVSPSMILFAIGNTTARALRAKSNNTVVVSETPMKEYMVDKVIAYFHK